MVFLVLVSGLWGNIGPDTHEPRPNTDPPLEDCDHQSRILLWSRQSDPDPDQCLLRHPGSVKSVQIHQVLFDSLQHKASQGFRSTKRAMKPPGSLSVSPGAGLRCPSFQLSSRCLQLAGGRSPSPPPGPEEGAGAPRKTWIFGRSHMTGSEVQWIQIRSWSNKDLLSKYRLALADS